MRGPPHRQKRTKNQLDTSVRQWVRFHPNCQGAKIEGEVHEVRANAPDNPTWSYSYRYVQKCPDLKRCDSAIASIIGDLQQRYDLDLTPRMGPREHDVFDLTLWNGRLS